jgi:hypothetical protein
MALLTTIGATRKFATAANRVKLDYEPHRHIVQPYKAAFCLLLGGAILGQNAMGKDVVKATSKALIQSAMSNSMRVRNQDFGTIPYKVVSAAQKTGIVAGTPFTHAMASASGAKVNDLWKNTVTGVVYYTSAVNGATLTLNIQAGGTDNIEVGDPFVKVGSAHPDFWTFGTGISMEPEEYYNLMQTHCNEVGIGLLASQQDVYPKGSGNEEDRMVILEHHTVGRELAFIDGVRASTTQGGEIVQSADGLRSMAEIVVDCGGSLSYESFRKDIETRVAKPGPTRWMTGTLVKAIVSLWNDAKVQTSQKEGIYGSDVEEIQGLFRHKIHVTEPMEMYPGEALLFKDENLKRRFYGKLDTIWLEKVHASNTAGEVDAYVTSECLQRTDEDSVTRLTGVFA